MDVSPVHDATASPPEMRCPICLEVQRVNWWIRLFFSKMLEQILLMVQKKNTFLDIFFAVVKNGDGSYTFSLKLFFPSNWFSRQISGCHQQYVKKDIDFRALPGHGGLNHPVPIWYFQTCTADSSAFLRQFPQFHGCATWKLLAFL